MSVLASPVWEDWPVPPLGPQRHGYFVLLRLDTEASVRQLDDDEASRAAALLPRDWYLGLVLSNGGAQLKNANGRELLNFKFCLVGEGPPDPVSNSIPIAPAPQVSDNRPPVQLPAPLPRSNLYIHTLVRAGGVVTRIHRGPETFEAVLSDEQQTWVYTCHFMDVIKDDEAALQQAEAESEPVSMPDCPIDDNESVSGASTISFDIQSIDDVYDKVRVHVEIWLDPSSCPGPLAIPATWTETMTRLKGIWKDWYDRRVEEVKTMGVRKAGEWIQAMDDANDPANIVPPNGQQVGDTGDTAVDHVEHEHRSRPQSHIELDVLDGQDLRLKPVTPTTPQCPGPHPGSEVDAGLDNDMPAESQPTVVIPVDVRPGVPPAARKRFTSSALKASLRAPNKTVRKVATLPAKVVRGMLSSLRSTISKFKARRSPAQSEGQPDSRASRDTRSS